MIWQDYLMAGSQFFFTLLAISLVFSDKKPSRWFCAGCALLLCNFVVCSATLGLWFYCAMNCTAMSTYTFLIFQRRTNAKT